VSEGFEDWLTMDQVAVVMAGAMFAFAGVVMLCRGDHEGALQASRESLEYYRVMPLISADGDRVASPSPRCSRPAC